MLLFIIGIRDWKIVCWLLSTVFILIQEAVFLGMEDKFKPNNTVSNYRNMHV